MRRERLIIIPVAPVPRERASVRADAINKWRGDDVVLWPVIAAEPSNETACKAVMPACHGQGHVGAL